ncbi:MAG: ABC1 kinase family protein, partial [Arenimonas sp.]
MSEAARLTAISAFLLKHRGCALFHPYTVDAPEPSTRSSGIGPEEFTKDLEALGPTFVKVGQMLSTRPDLLPPDYIAALGRLQDKALPCDFESIKTMIETELGTPIHKVFEEFEPVPVGTASFAQVHLARLRSGREVAVKVQRPNLASQVEADLLSISRLISSLGLVSNVGTRLGFSDWLEEFHATVTDELDYLKEANNLDTFKELLKDYNRISVPTPVWDYTTRRVLTMERAKGIRVTDIPDVLRTEVDMRPLAGILCKAYL